VKSLATFLFVLLLTSGTARAQHLRIFACAIANDSAGAFMGGSSNGSGLYQSDDTGKSWKHLGWDNIKCYSMDAVQSSNGRILYMATGLGVLRSTDYGERWKQLTDWRIAEVTDVAVNQKTPKEIWIATAHGPWRTLDAGIKWTFMGKGIEPYCEMISYKDPNYDSIYLVGSINNYWHSAKGNGHWIINTTFMPITLNRPDANTSFDLAFNKFLRVDNVILFTTLDSAITRITIKSNSSKPEFEQRETLLGKHEISGIRSCIITP
jgi:hypothetical protein